MKIRILKPEVICIESHIRLAFPVGTETEIGDADAVEAIRQGIAEQLIDAPQEVAVMEPQEKAVAAPKEKKAKEE